MYSQNVDECPLFNSGSEAGTKITVPGINSRRHQIPGDNAS